MKYLSLRDACKKALSLIALSVISTYSLGQQMMYPGTVEGTAVDAKFQPLPYAIISLLKVKDSSAVKGSIASPDGKFRFDRVPYGHYLVSISMAGYKKIYSSPFSIDTNLTVVLLREIALQSFTQQLEEVKITAKKPIIERQTDKMVVNVENTILAVGNSAFEILERAPGVSLGQGGSLSLNGKQGVLLMVDGKRTFLNPEQQANLLKSLNGDGIQLIELISNPSAKYDAAGSAGIINIRLKKNKKHGTNGSILAGLGYGRYAKYNGGITINHQNNRFNLFGSYNYSDNKFYSNLDQTRSNSLFGLQTFFNEVNLAVRDNATNNYKAGLDYFINETDVIGVAVSGYYNSGTLKAVNTTSIGSSMYKSDSSNLSNNFGTNKFSGITTNVNYRKGSNLTLDLDYSRYQNDEQINYNNTYYKANGQQPKPSDTYRSNAPSEIKVFAAKLDYNHAINSKTNLEIGLKSSIVNTNNDYDFENLEGNSWIKNLNLSNQFTYDENINSLYANLNSQFKTITASFGFRAEQTNSTGDLLTNQNTTKRNYLNLFPNLSLSKSLDKNNVIGFSYSRRVDRPDYASLNPFLQFVSTYFFGQGNPFLKPQFTNAFELSYGLKKTFNIALGYNHTSDVMTQVLLTDSVKKTLILTTQNLATQNFYRLNLSSPINIFKFWSSFNNLVFYYNDYSTPDLLGHPYASGRLSFQFNTAHTVKINSSLQAEISGNYTSTKVYGTYIIKPIYGVDFGISKAFAGKRGSIKLASNDIFNQRKLDISSSIPFQNYQVMQKNESRIFRLSVSYNFGNDLIKAAKQRKKVSSDEESRIKKN